MENFAKIIEALATLFFGVGFVVFFGPIITFLSIVGKFKLGLINLDWSKQSKFTRAVLGFIGLSSWLAIYIPLVVLAFRAVPQTPSPTVNNQVQNPVSSETPTLVIALPTATILPTIMSTPSLVSNVVDPTFIVITEVSGDPCGGDARNEFIELYNSGETSIDVGGWWITDGTYGQKADKIVALQSRYSNINIGYLMVMNSTIIPPHGYAVILAPSYPLVQSGSVMPYVFPENTIILTVENGQLLGDEKNGITVVQRDVIVLYQGTESTVENVISTYGSPRLSTSQSAIGDDDKDDIPFIVGECGSVERILAVNEDVESNWRISLKPSPGSGNYP